MKVKVWDTYVSRSNGQTMHFDIIAPDHIEDEKIIYQFGKEYLISKNEGDQTLDANECQFCHIENASAEIVDSINEKGYYILEMQNCDNISG